MASEAVAKFSASKFKTLIPEGLLGELSSPTNRQLGLGTYMVAQTQLI